LFAFVVAVCDQYATDILLALGSGSNPLVICDVNIVVV